MLALACLLLALLAAAPAGAVTQYELTLPNHPLLPVFVTPGPGGDIWFGEGATSKIGRVRTDGTLVAEYALPTPNAQPLGLAYGPDGAIWAAEGQANKIARVTASGQVDEYDIPTPDAGPTLMTAGPDGAIWFTEQQSGKIGRITTSGQVTEYDPPTPNTAPVGITVGSDGALWFTEQQAGKIGRVTTAGAFTEYDLPSPNPFPTGIAAGPDGNLWVTGVASRTILRVSTSGQVTGTYPLPPGDIPPLLIAPGPDGNMWFGEADVNGTPTGEGRLGRVTMDGQVTEYPQPAPNASIFGVTTGPDGNIWFADTNFENGGNDTIGRLVTDQPHQSQAPSIGGSPLAGGRLTASPGGWSGNPTFSYSWQRCDGSACSPIDGATGSSYTPTAADIGKTLRVVVTATNADGSTRSTSAETLPVAAGALVPARPPAPRATLYYPLCRNISSGRGRDRRTARCAARVANWRTLRGFARSARLAGVEVNAVRRSGAGCLVLSGGRLASMSCAAAAGTWTPARLAPRTFRRIAYSGPCRTGRHARRARCHTTVRVQTATWTLAAPLTAGRWTVRVRALDAGGARQASFAGRATLRLTLR